MKRSFLQTSLTFFFCFGLLFLGSVKAQDIHSSMFNRTPTNINPGLIGVFGGDLRVTANYRRQWQTVPVDYRTFMVSFEHKLNIPKVKRGFFTGGLFFNNDDAGDLSLGQNQFGLSGSYIRPLTSSADNRHFLSFGLQAGLTQRNYNTRGIRTDLQYIDGTFNAINPTGEEGLLDENASFGSLSGGINYRYQKPASADKRMYLDLGGAVYHLARGNKSFEDDQSIRLDRRISLYGITAFQIHKKIDLGALISGQFQGPHSELLIGGNARLYLKKVSLLLGLSYRALDNDALIPNVNLDYRNFSFGFSWDWNISDFQVATNGNGGPELSLIYTLGKSRVEEEVKIPCLFF